MTENGMYFNLKLNFTNFMAYQNFLVQILPNVKHVFLVLSGKGGYQARDSQEDLHSQPHLIRLTHLFLEDRQTVVSKQWSLSFLNYMVKGEV